MKMDMNRSLINSTLSLLVILIMGINTWGQTCLELPEINGIPQSFVSPSGWNIWNSTPDIIVGNGSYPGSAYGTITDVDGTSIAGGEMAFFLINGSLGNNTEALRTEITGLTPGNIYLVAIEWQQVTLDYSIGVIDPAGGKLGVFLDGVQLATFTSSGGIDDSWQTAFVTFTATTTNHTIGYKGELLNNTNYGAIVIDNLPCGTPLPIELTNFEAAAMDASALLSWTTTVELNNDFFTIERSTDMIQWNILDTIEGAGNSNNTIHYSYIDSTRLSQTTYYRLKQTDFNGASEYSEVRSVAWNLEFSDQLILYPNPAVNVLTISGNEVDKISILDLTGRLIELDALIISMSKTKMVLDISQLNSGNYLIRSPFTTKMVRVR